MSTIEERTAYLQNPYFTKHIYGNFSPFYITIAICTVIGISIILLNIICTCCSKYRSYWQDRHTGNRWIVSIWSATPHKQPPLDLTELKTVEEIRLITHSARPQETVISASIPEEAPQRPPRHESSRSLLRSAPIRQEDLELQQPQRESDI